jgi:hypothetical protein
MIKQLIEYGTNIGGTKNPLNIYHVYQINTNLQKTLQMCLESNRSLK